MVEFQPSVPDLGQGQRLAKKIQIQTALPKIVGKVMKGPVLVFNLVGVFLHRGHGHARHEVLLLSLQLQELQEQPLDLLTLGRHGLDVNSCLIDLQNFSAVGN